MLNASPRCIATSAPLMSGRPKISFEQIRLRAKIQETIGKPINTMISL